MSGQAYVVIPVGADGNQPAEQDKTKIASALQESLNEQMHPAHHEEHRGPLKELLAHQNSLYKYISWENPIRTICSYICVMSILLGTHYLPLTQLALKAGASTLGLISVTEFVCRLFGPDTFIARLRPKEYKKVPESTLNDSLKDIHDFIQYSVVQAQRILYGQNLDKTFATFLGLTAMYWLVNAASPFSISVLAVTSLYIVPLIISPRGREVAHDASLLARDVANTAVDNGKALAHCANAKAADQSEKLREISMETGRRVGNVAHSGVQAVVDLPTGTKGTASESTEATKGSTTGLDETGRNGINKSPGTIHSGLVDRNPVSHNSFPAAREHISA